MRFHIVYVCDAWPAIGMGHLARAIKVLGELRNQASDLAVALAGNFSESARAFLDRSIPDGVALLEEDSSAWSAAAVALDTMAEPGNPIALDRGRAAALKARCQTLILVSSSLEVETSFDIDVLIDHMPDVQIIGPRPGRCLLGLKYAPVDHEFFDVKPVPVEDAEALVAVIGGSSHQTGPRTVAGLFPPDRGLNRGSFGTLEMAVSPHFPQEELEVLRHDHPDWTFHQNLPSIVPLMARARAVVCTYGNVTYESLALGRPTFVLAYEPFQERYAATLESRGLVVSCGPFDGPREDRLALLFSAEVLHRLSKRAREAGVQCGVGSIARALREEVARVQVA